MHTKSCFMISLILASLIAILSFSGIAASQEKDENASARIQEAASINASIETKTKNKDEKVEKVTVFQLIMKGGIIGGMIILLSFVSLGLVIDYAYTIRQNKLAPPEDIATFKKLAHELKSEELTSLTREKSSFLAQVVSAGLNEIHLGYNAMIKAMEDTSEALSARLARKIEHLNIIANISPMMGLLGTVIGMLRCFNDISRVTGSIDPKQLAGGIFEALVTTCLGLIVAIPSLYFYAIFRNRIDEFAGETSIAAEDIVASYKPQSNKEDK